MTSSSIRMSARRAVAGRMRASVTRLRCNARVVLSEATALTATQAPRRTAQRSRVAVVVCGKWRPTGAKRRSNGGNRNQANGAEPDEQPPMMNEGIMYSQLRVVASDGTFLGVMSRQQALARAREEALDLVVIQESGDLPVCKVISYSKYRYQKEKAKKEMRKKSRQHRQAVKELKVRVGIGINDYNVRLRAAKKFLGGGDKVKMSIQFRGREVVFANLGRDLLTKFAGEVEELSTIARQPVLTGRTMQMMLSPIKSKAEVVAEKERQAKAKAKAAKKSEAQAALEEEEEEEEEFDDSIFEDVVLDSDAAAGDDDGVLEAPAPSEEDIALDPAKEEEEEEQVFVTAEADEETVVAAEMIAPVNGGGGDAPGEAFGTSANGGGGDAYPADATLEEGVQEKREEDAVVTTAASPEPERASDPFADLLKKPPARPQMPGLSRRPPLPTDVPSRGATSGSPSSSSPMRQRRMMPQKMRSRVNVDTDPPVIAPTPAKNPSKALINASTPPKTPTSDDDPTTQLRRPVRPPVN